MIKNRAGDAFVHGSQKYVIGDLVIGTDQSEYAGLFGYIKEIRDGDDKDTDNETPDIYCNFELPVLETDIKELEKRFSELYEEVKKAEDIILDDVIMAPDMIKPLAMHSDAEKNIVVYSVSEDWCVDGESGANQALFADYDAAKHSFSCKLRDMLTEMGEAPFDTTEQNKDYYETYNDGEYIMNHYLLKIEAHQLQGISKDVLYNAKKFKSENC